MTVFQEIALSTSNKNIFFKQNMSRDIANSLIASNTNYNYQHARQRYKTLTLFDTLTLFVWQLLMQNLTSFYSTYLSTSHTKECHVVHINVFAYLN